MVTPELEYKIVKDFTSRLYALKNDPTEIERIGLLLQASIHKINDDSGYQSILDFIDD